MNIHWKDGVEAEAPILWSPDLNNWLIWKDLDAAKDWGQEEKGMTEDEMVWWHHWLNGHEFEQAPGVGNGQGSLVCYSPRGGKESDMTEWLNWTERKHSDHSVTCFSWMPPMLTEKGALTRNPVKSLSSKQIVHSNCKSIGKKNCRDWLSLEIICSMSRHCLDSASDSVGVCLNKWLQQCWVSGHQQSIHLRRHWWLLFTAHFLALDLLWSMYVLIMEPTLMAWRMASTLGSSLVPWQGGLWLPGSSLIRYGSPLDQESFYRPHSSSTP